MKRILFLTSIFLINTLYAQKDMSINQLKEKILKYISEIQGKAAVSFIDFQTHESFSINGNEEFHAASTMKLPVMIELFRQSEANEININDSVLVKNEFISIADGSIFSLSEKDDSDDEIYSFIDKNVSLMELCKRMITKSSNLATNILVELVGTNKIMTTLQNAGIQNIVVLRGVEDIQAFRQGLNNVVTANDLASLLDLILKNKFTNSENTERILDIMLMQEFNDIIPELLPSSIKVAHKTGRITGIIHDAAIIFLPDGRKYILVLLTKNLVDENSAKKILQKISLEIYNYFIENK